MNKYKVFLANGTIQTVVAHSWAIEWNDAVGVLRFSIGDVCIAVFPPGGWNGVQDVEVYKNMKVAV